MDPELKAYYEELKPVLVALTEKVFEPLASRLEAEPGLRRSLNPAFPWPKFMALGFLDKGLAIEFIGPAVNDSNIIIHTEDSHDTTLAEFLGMDEEVFERSQRAYYGVPGINTHYFLGSSIARLNEFKYDYASSNSIASLNGYDDLEQAKEPTYWSNVTFFWTPADNGELRVRHIDFLLYYPVGDPDEGYAIDINFNHLRDIILRLPTPTFDVQRHNDLNRLIELLYTDGVTEPEITRFLTDVPELLQLAFGFRDLNAQVFLEWQYATDVPNLKPDFLPVGMDGFANILDFKMPTLKHAPIVGQAQRRHPSNEVDTAIAQLARYEAWCSQEVNQRWLLDTHQIRIQAPLRYIIMGRTHEFPPEDRQRLRATRNTQIYTYDEFLDLVRNQIYRVH